MKLPNGTVESQEWRITEIVHDFTLEDVWALPVHGAADDFPALVGVMTSGSDLVGSMSVPARLLWQVRDRLGRYLDVGRISAPSDREAGGPSELPIPGTHERSLRDRLPDDLRDTAVDLRFASVPFEALYRTAQEFAAELSNRTVHGVLHLAWVDRGDGRYQGQMAVYVKPRGLLGTAYMAFIKPFRYWVVYPSLLRQIGRAWDARVRPDGTVATVAG